MKYYFILVLTFISVDTIGQSTANKIQTNGNIGIGTTSPNAKLEIVGRTLMRGSLEIRGETFAQFIQGRDSDKRGVTLGSNDFGLKTRYRGWAGGSRAYNQIWYDQGGTDFFYGNSKTPIFSIREQGVGLGTDNLTHSLTVAGSGKFSGAKSDFTEINSNNNGQYIRQFGNDGSSISWVIRGYANNGLQAEFKSGGILVQGKVQAEEVNITMDGWADYVFEENYPLMDLDQLKLFISENKHLPGIPNAKKVSMDGINLSEINVKLLEKVEELTLYILLQEERIQEIMKLREDIDLLKEAVLID
jgi:hypothetical protein